MRVNGQLFAATGRYACLSQDFRAGTGDKLAASGQAEGRGTSGSESRIRDDFPVSSLPDRAAKRKFVPDPTPRKERKSREREAMARRALRQGNEPRPYLSALAMIPAFTGESLMSPRTQLRPLALAR